MSSFDSSSSTINTIHTYTKQNKIIMWNECMHYTCLHIFRLPRVPSSISLSSLTTITSLLPFHSSPSVNGFYYIICTYHVVLIFKHPSWITKKKTRNAYYFLHTRRSSILLWHCDEILGVRRMMVDLSLYIRTRHKVCNTIKSRVNEGY